MKEENQQNLAPVDDDPDVTLVSPLFGEEATEAARPVVPLSATGDASAARAGVDRAPHTGRAPARRSWIVVLVLVSTLAGSVLGGLGLRFYQQRRRAAVPTTAPHQAGAPAESQQPAPTPAVIESDKAARTETAPPAVIEDVEGSQAPIVAADPEGAGRDSRVKAKNGGRGDDAVAGARKPSDERTAPDDDGKRNRDDQAARDRQRPRRVEASGPDADETPVYDDEPEPRRIDRIRDIMGGRRAARRARERREREQRQIDRVRGIFEGSPPR